MASRAKHSHTTKLVFRAQCFCGAIAYETVTGIRLLRHERRLCTSPAHIIAGISGRALSVKRLPPGKRMAQVNPAYER